MIKTVEHQFTAEFKDHLRNNFEEVLANAGISFLEIEVTGRCKNNCEYCGVGGPADINLPIDELIKFIEEWDQEVRQKGNCPVVSLTGGDPLLYPDLKILLKVLDSLSIDYLLKTNAHSIDSNIIKLPRKPSAIKLTIPDGINCGRNHDSIADLLNATSLLHDLEIDVIWQASVHSTNMNELLDIIQSINNNQPITLSVGRILPFTKDALKYTVSADEYGRFLKQLLDIYSTLYKKGIELRFRENLWIPILGEMGLLPEKNQLSTTQCCDCFQCQLSIDREGIVYPCGLLRKTVLGHISQSPAKLFLKREERMVPGEFECFTCQYFNFCGGCAGAAETITGLKTNLDPHCFLKYGKEE